MIDCILFVIKLIKCINEVLIKYKMKELYTKKQELIQNNNSKHIK